MTDNSPPAPRTTPEPTKLMIDGIPRANRTDHWSRAERAIQDAVDVCERHLPADILETEAITLLANARAKVAQLVDREIQSGRMEMPSSPPAAPVPIRVCDYWRGLSESACNSSDCEACVADAWRQHAKRLAAPAASLSGTPAPIDELLIADRLRSGSPAPTDRVQEIEARLAKAIGWMAAGGRFTADSTRSMCEDIEYLLARVRSLEADAREMKTRVEALPRWGLVHRVGEAPDLDITPRGSLLDRGSVLHLLAAHPLEAPANGQ